MNSFHDHHLVEHEPDPLQWKWIGLGIGLGALLIWTFLFLVDPHLERLIVAGYVLALALILSGILVGRLSPGETIRETAIVGGVLVVGSGGLASVFLDTGVPIFMWLVAPLYAAPLTMLGGWVGEMLQGTLVGSRRDEMLDWPWVIVSVVVGLALSTFAVLVASSRFGIEPTESLWIFAVSFLATGLMVGYFSPGRTLVEPAVAAGLMTVINAGFLITWFGELPVGQLFIVGFGGSIVLALVGGWLGERLQDMKGPREGDLNGA